MSESKGDIEELVDNIMVSVSQNMHFKNQTNNNTPILRDDGDGYFSPLCGTVLKIGRREEINKEYTEKLQALITKAKEQTARDIWENIVKWIDKKEYFPDDSEELVINTLEFQEYLKKINKGKGVEWWEKKGLLM